MGRFRLFLLFIAGVCIGFAYFVLTTDFRSPEVRHAFTKNLSNARQLAVACKLYAADNEGKFPARLGDLVPDYIATQDSLNDLRYRGVGGDGKSLTLLDWFYFGEGVRDTDSLPVLIASPEIIETGRRGPRRIVVASDTSGMVIQEAEHQKRLADTMKQIRTLKDANRALASPTPATKPQATD